MVVCRDTGVWLVWLKCLVVCVYQGVPVVVCGDARVWLVWLKWLLLCVHVDTGMHVWWCVRSASGKGMWLVWLNGCGC